MLRADYVANSRINLLESSRIVFAILNPRRQNRIELELENDSHKLA